MTEVYGKEKSVVKKKILAIVLCFAMVVCCLPTFAFAASDQMKVGDNRGTKGVVDYVALGDSIAVGFGTGECSMNSYEGIYTINWKTGYGRAAEGAYSKQLEKLYPKTMTSWSGAMCGLRAEDVLSFINKDEFGEPNHGGDDYFYNFYENTLKNCYVDAVASGPMNYFTYSYLPGNIVYSETPPTIKEINKDFTSRIKNSDFVTITAGGNNFFSYLSSKIINIFAGTSLYSMGNLDERCYYDYMLYPVYVYAYQAGDELDQGVYSNNPTTGICDVNKNEGVTCSTLDFRNDECDGEWAYVDGDKTKEKRTPTKIIYNMMMGDGSSFDLTTMKAYKFSDYANVHVTVPGTTEEYQVGPYGGKTEKQYIEDMQKYYNQFYPNELNDIDTIKDLNEKLTELYQRELDNTSKAEEDLTWFYDQSVVNKFNLARTVAEKAAKVAGKITGNESLDTTVTAVFDLIKSILYTTASFNEALPELVTYIHKLNPDAKIAITGLPPAFCDYAIKVTDKYTINVADLVMPFYKIINKKMQKIAADNSDYCVAIDITKAEMISQQNMGAIYEAAQLLSNGKTLSGEMIDKLVAAGIVFGYDQSGFVVNDDAKAMINGYASGITKLSTPDSCGNQYRMTVDALTFGTSALTQIPLSHPSEAGHAYIAKQIDNAFDFTIEKKGIIRTALENLWNAIFKNDGNSFFKKLFGSGFSSLFSGNLIAEMFK